MGMSESLTYKELQKIYQKTKKENWYLKENLENKRIYVEDNNGGDIIELILSENNQVELRIGQHCIYLFIGYGTVSEIVEKLRKRLDKE
jgi:hypothetical protein